MTLDIVMRITVKNIAHAERVANQIYQQMPEGTVVASMVDSPEDQLFKMPTNKECETRKGKRTWGFE